jgi:hypothetical protein
LGVVSGLIVINEAKNVGKKELKKIINLRKESIGNT